MKKLKMTQMRMMPLKKKINRTMKKENKVQFILIS